MCSGAYENTGWTVGQGMTVTRNDSYWDTSVKPKTKSIKLIAAADPTAITAGLLSGDITGIYMTGPTGTLQQLESSGKVTVTQGASYVVDALITSTGNGVLTDPVVRKALSMAIDRPAYISAVWEGAASLPKALNPPATWGYGKDVFAAGYAALPDMTPDIAGAKALVADKGLAGKSITIAYIQLPPNAAEANAVKSAAESIGLTVKLKAVAPDAYINLFIDPEFRKGIDGWFTLNYPDYADPLSLLRSVVVPDASQNYIGYSNPTVTQEIAAATASADPAARAAHVVAAQKMIAEELPWIPMAFPNNVNATATSISGQTASFSYMFAGWANDLGGTGQ